jgi:hypothetical protein
MADSSLPLKDPDGEHPVADVWRDTFRTIVARVVGGDYELRGIPGVQPLSPEVGLDVLRDRMANYDDVTLAELPDAAWDTSVAMWGGSDYWDVLVDLHTVEEGRSDLVLGARVTETSDGYSFEVHMIYVP